MKLLHTADWHLGKKIEGRSRHEEQVEVMEEICQLAEQHMVDAVLVAGDLFDQFNPPTESIDLFYKTIKQLTRNGACPVIAIAGNHDSPDLVEVPEPLAKECGIFLVGHPYTELPIFETSCGINVNQTAPGFLELELPSQQDKLRLLTTPYANEFRLKEFLKEDKEAELRKILQVHWQQLADKYCDTKGINILMAHLFFTDKAKPSTEEPEGEKPIMIGGASALYVEHIPKQIQYTALGHLHRYQNLAKKEKPPVVYSSSPLSYSFSEAGQTKRVVIIEAEAGKPVEYEKIALKSGKPLVRKTFDSVNDAEEWIVNNQDCWLELSIKTETFLDGQVRKSLNEKHAGIVSLIPLVEMETPEVNTKNNRDIDLSKNLEELFVEYFEFKNKTKPSDDLMELFKEVSAVENEE